MSPASPLVSTDWLATRLEDPLVQIIDGSWFVPGWPQDAETEFHQSHIPGAVFFDIDSIADPDSQLPHCLPSQQLFELKVRALGLKNDTRIIAYDQAGTSTSARVWWMLRVMGHENVAVLDGGFPKWCAEGLPVVDASPEPNKGDFVARLNPALLRSIEDVCKALEGGCEQVIDARATARFVGDVDEPRPGLARGHMPGARNIPFSELTSENLTLAPPETLKIIFEAAGVEVERPAVTTCGSGVTACVVALALARLGRWDAAVYDGSWSEWGSRRDLPVATGGA